MTAHPERQEQDHPLCACGRPADIIPTAHRFYLRNRRQKTGKKPTGGRLVADEPICSRCDAIDGRTQNYYDVIAALRDFGRLTPYEVGLILDINANHACTILARLRKAGRVEKIIDSAIEAPNTESEGRSGYTGGIAYRLARD